MYGDESQHEEVLKNQLNIAIVDSKTGENELFQSLNKKMKEESTKFKVTVLNNLDELIKVITLNLYDESNCLLNMQWLDTVYNVRPSVIILYYYINEGSTKDEEEISISKIIDKIKYYDQNLPLYLFIIAPKEEYDKYQHLKDDNKSPNSLLKKLKKESFYIFSSREIFKTIELKKLYDNLILYSRNYYRAIKYALINKRKDAKNTEEYIKYTIMIGILSIVKSKKKNPCFNKHLKEAYGALSGRNFNHKKYFYGNPERVVQNFFEIKAIADWLLFKIIKLNGKKEEEALNSNSKKKAKLIEKEKHSDILIKVNTFLEHIKTFCSHDYGNKRKDDKFYYYRYIWAYKRLTNLDKFCDEYFNEIKEDKNFMINIVQIKFQILYNFIKIIKFYQKNYINLDLTKTINDSKEIPISSIDISNNPFYGKPPIYYYTDASTGKKITIGYNDDIFLKKTILQNHLTLKDMDDKIKELINNSIKFYYKLNILEKGFEISNIDNENNIGIFGVKLYLNLLRFYTNYPNDDKPENKIAKLEDEKDINIFLYKIIDKTKYIRKFPKIYIKCLNKIIEYLIYQMEHQKENKDFNNEKKTILFKSLSNLAFMKLLSEKEQDIFNTLLDDDTFTPVHYEIPTRKPSFSFEITNFFIGDSETPKKEKEKEVLIENKNNENENEKNDDINQYIKTEDFVINLYTTNKELKKNDTGISFDYNIKDIEKSQERKILDLVEYEFKISTKLSKLKIKFENIKIFFSYINRGTEITKQKYKSETMIKEFTLDDCPNMELTSETPIILEHKIFLKYRKGQIKVNKILASLSKKKNIFYCIYLQSDIHKVIFIKDIPINLLKFDYIKKYRVGKNQYNPFELTVSKEKNDEVEIKDLKIEFELLPTFEIKEMYNNKSAKKSQVDLNIATNSFFIPQKNNKNKISDILGINNDSPSEKRFSVEENAIRQAKHNAQLSLELKKNTGIKNVKAVNEKKSLKSAIKGKKEDTVYIQKNSTPNNTPPPEFYIYNSNENKLDKYNEKMEITYNDFESLLNKGKNKYTTLIRFLGEGSYKIKFSILYFIRHKEIEDYIEYREDSILDYDVVPPFSFLTNIVSNNFLTSFRKLSDKSFEEKIRYYLTDCKIGINFELNNRIEQNIKIKDIQIINNENHSIKYINSYINDLIHSYDLDDEEKNEILIIQKNSSYAFPIEVEFSQSFKGSIGKINIIWSTESLDNFEGGKFNILNKEEFSFPELEVKPLEFKYKYETEINEDDEINMKLSIKNVSEKTKYINVNISNNNENYDKNFIIIGLVRQNHLIGINEEIDLNYTLIPTAKGELDYPCFQISEYDLKTMEKKNINNYFPENIVII